MLERIDVRRRDVGIVAKIIGGIEAHRRIASLRPTHGTDIDSAHITRDAARVGRDRNVRCPGIAVMVVEGRGTIALVLRRAADLDADGRHRPGVIGEPSRLHEGTEPINAQIRVFKWSIVNGKEQLNPTDDVVASPPSVTLTPRGQYVVRIVRMSKQPVVGEESYRLLVDQLPDLSQQRNGAVNLMVRYSIPVFFGAANKKSPTVAWSVAPNGDKITLTARNSGDRRLRISALSLRDASGKSFSFGSGLAGYALGQSAVSWTVPRQGFAARLDFGHGAK